MKKRGYADGTNEIPRCGVDIKLAKNAIAALTGKVTFRREGDYGTIGKIGHYAGLIDFGKHVIALTTDGVGTKMLIADLMNNWRTVGIDCVAMNVNDLFVMNIEPIAFVDYIATGKLYVDQMEQIGMGLNEGVKLANVNLVGGETAQLPDLVNGLDLAGSCMGIQEKEKVVTGEKIVPGDYIVGVPSSGIHSNGLSLARKIMADTFSKYTYVLPDGATVGQSLLTPTRIYRESLDVCKKVDVHGMCHITGGGFLNFTRLSEYGFRFTDHLPIPPIFTYLQQLVRINDMEMYRTFNMGMGFAYIVPKEEAKTVQRMVPGSRIVGVVVKEKGVWVL